MPRGPALTCLSELQAAVRKFLARTERGISGFGPKITLECVNDTSVLRQIHAAALSASKELAYRRLKLREGCAPFPQHETRLPNICSSVKH